MTRTRTTPLQPFAIPPADPLADAHAAVAAWVEVGNFAPDDLKTDPTGLALLAASRRDSCRHVRTAMVQVDHWDQVKQARANDPPRRGFGYSLAHDQASARSRRARAVCNTLLRRSLPLDADDFRAILAWFAVDRELLSIHYHAVAPVIRRLEEFAARESVPADLRTSILAFGSRMKANTYLKRDQELVARLQNLTRAPAATLGADPTPILPAPRPAPVGMPHVLVALKLWLGIPVDPAQRDAPTSPIKSDGYPVADASPLRDAHEWLGTQFRSPKSPTLAKRSLLSLEPALLGRVILAAAERQVAERLGPDARHPHRPGKALEIAFTDGEVRERFELDRAGLFDLNLFCLAQHPYDDISQFFGQDRLRAELDRSPAREPLTEGERYALSLLRAVQIEAPLYLDLPAPTGWLTSRIDDNLHFFFQPMDVWGDAANVELSRLDTAAREMWTALLGHVRKLSGTRPSAKWLAAARERVAAAGEGGELVQQALFRWLPMVARGRTFQFLPISSGYPEHAVNHHLLSNQEVLRQLVWLAPVLPQPGELARPLGQLAVWAFGKIPGVGPRAGRVGNAAIGVLAGLGSTTGVGQLAVLKNRIKFAPAQKEISKAFTAAAKALNLPADEVEELAVPTYGLEAVGRRVETFGGYRVEVAITGSDVTLTWSDPQGKPLKAVPTRVKADHKEEWKDLQGAVKDIAAMIPAQRDRLDSLFLLDKSWPVATWVERYGNHPVVGTLARQLIWQVDGVLVVFPDGTFRDVTGNPIAAGPEAQVTPWHPIGRPIAEVLTWRDRLEALSIVQPFRQAHREVYLLTDAERHTTIYSNRFAAHILRQHQFNTLCAARGWKNSLRLGVDDSVPPASRALPLWNLRAEFWVAGAGHDLNDAGTFLRLITDQVRFYRLGAATNQAHASGGPYQARVTGPGPADINEPLPLDQIPPLVFSEIMRDVDLFVGVASVGNDPTWQDGGPEGRYQNYWQTYAFGELSGTATTRKQVLERLVPRLKIADRCTFDGRFLKVRGQQRTYKIHLGSGNILMEPDDQYLCIVPDGRERAAEANLFLPFEGDTMLSVILSKAFLLAADDKIKDRTITSQINRR